MKLRRFLRSPKGLLIMLLTAMAIAGVWASGPVVVPDLAAAVLTAALIDAPILRIRKRRWEIPDGAILTGLIIAMVLSPFGRWWIAASTAAVAIASKYLFRSRTANIFNPAAFALVATCLVFDTGQNWWGALPDLGWIGLVALFAAGIFIADRVNKMPLVLGFLGCYYLIFTAAAFLGNPENVAEIFRTPDLQAVLYLAFFILTDPPTSPIGYRDQLVYAVIVAIASYGFFEGLGVVYYLLAGVLAGNLWEAWRRVRVRRRKATRVSPRVVPASGAT